MEEIKALGYQPNYWEEKFLDSIEQNDWDLSFKQSKCLEKIYAKASGGGDIQESEDFG